MALTRIDSYLVDLDSLGGVTFDDQAGTPTFKVDAVNHRVGIGTSNPEQKLHVQGSIRAQITGGGTGILLHSNTGWSAASNLAQFWTGQTEGFAFYANDSGNGTNERLRITASGNVGIGTTNPGVKLDVDGIIRLTASGNYTSYATRLYSRLDSTHCTVLESYLNSSTPFELIGSYADNGGTNPRVVISAGGQNVGIGTTNPTQKLHVEGNLRLGTDPYIQWISNYLRFQTTSASVPVIEIRESSSGNYEPRMDFYDGDGITKNISIDANPSNPTYFKAGNVGIGTTNPEYQFSVLGTAGRFSELLGNTIRVRIAASEGGWNSLIGFAANSGTFLGGLSAWGNIQAMSFLNLGVGTSPNSLTIHSSGNVGIGTTNPASKLHLRDTDAQFYQQATRGTGRTWYTGTSGTNAENFELLDSTGAQRAYLYGSSSGGYSGWSFYSNGVDRVRIDGSGNVGIGTTNPQAKLDVLGSTIISRPGTTEIGDNIYALKVGMGAELTNVAGRQFGLRVEQGGARYTDQTALYATHTNTVGNFAGNYRGVHGVTAFDTQAGGTTEAIFGETTIPNWNYQNRHCAVRGIAQGGGTTFSATYGLSANHGAFGGHFVAYGKADVVGVYADAYHVASPGAGTQAVPLLVASNGTQLMRVNANGNVGIGTTSPIAPTHIFRSTSGTALKLNNGTGGSGSYIDLDFDTYLTSQAGYANAVASIRVIDDGFFSGHITFRTKGASVGADQSEKLRITSSGNVGIGTDNPAEKLHVVGNIQNSRSFIGSITSKESDGTCKLQISNGTNSFYNITEGQDVAIRLGSGYLWNVNASSSFNGLRIGTNFNPFIGKVDSSLAAWEIDIGGRNAGDTGSDTFTVRRNGTSWSNLFTVKGDGNVGIGTTNPLRKLDVRGDILVKNVLNGDGLSAIMIASSVPDGNLDTTGVSIRTFVETAGANGYAMQFFTQQNYIVGQTEKMRISGSGDILINTSIGAGNANSRGFRAGAAGELILLANSGGLFHQVLSNYYLVQTTGGNTSDINLKKNINPISNPLDRVCAIRGVNFEFIEEPKDDASKGTQLGVIAQEVEQQFPEIVLEDQFGNKTVRYDRLVAPLIEAIKTLRDQNAQLEARIAALEA